MGKFNSKLDLGDADNYDNIELNEYVEKINMTLMIKQTNNVLLTTKFDLGSLLIYLLSTKVYNRFFPILAINNWQFSIRIDYNECIKPKYEQLDKDDKESLCGYTHDPYYNVVFVIGNTEFLVGCQKLSSELKFVNCGWLADDLDYEVCVSKALLKKYEHMKIYDLDNINDVFTKSDTDLIILTINIFKLLNKYEPSNKCEIITVESPANCILDGSTVLKSSIYDLSYQFKYLPLLKTLILAKLSDTDTIDILKNKLVNQKLMLEQLENNYKLLYEQHNLILIDLEHSTYNKKILDEEYLNISNITKNLEKAEAINLAENIKSLNSKILDESNRLNLLEQNKSNLSRKMLELTNSITTTQEKLTEFENLLSIWINKDSQLFEKFDVTFKESQKLPKNIRQNTKQNTPTSLADEIRLTKLAIRNII